MIELTVFIWWGLYIGALIIGNEDYSPRLSKIIFVLLGCFSVGFAYHFAETAEMYVISALILTAVHFMYSRLLTIILAISLIVLGYVIKFV